jgi:hypothetical protein
MFGLSIFSHFCCHMMLMLSRQGTAIGKTSNQKESVMMLIMRVVMTIRTGRCTPPSAARFARVPATRLAQHHPSPEVARELPHFLWKWHRLIEIGQELTKDISSRHSHVLLITFPPLYHSHLELRLLLPKISLIRAFALSRAPFQPHWLGTPITLHISLEG